MIGKSGEQRRRAGFYMGKEEVGRDFYAKFSLAGLLLGEEKVFLPLAVV